MLWGREASALKCYQFSLALQSGHNHTYYSYNYKIAFTVFFQGKSKIEFWREDEDFLRLLFKGPQQLRLPFWFLLQKKKKCRKLLNQKKKKVFRQWVEIQFLQFGPNQMSTSKIYYAWEIKGEPNLELQRLNSILVALLLYVYSISVKCELTIPWGPTDRWFW